MQSVDEEALVRYNEEFDPPFESPPQEVCAQLWAATRKGHDAFHRCLRNLEPEGWEMTRLLCSSNDLGQNFLHITAESGDWRILQIIQGFFTVRHPPVPLYVSIPRKRLPVQPDKDGNTPLHIAAIHDHLEVAKSLMQYYNHEHVSGPLNTDGTLEDNDGAKDWSAEAKMEFCPRLRFLLDLNNHAGLTASQAGQAAGATTTANWLHNLRKQGADGIEYVAGEESDVEWQ